jgi:ankyrin repeat protein
MFNSVGIGDALQIIASQDWEFFRSAVLSRPTFFRNLANAVSSCSELSGMTLLHAAVRYNAPQYIIVEMIRLCPDMSAAKDCLGRTPLHVAAGSKASASLLGTLAHACPAACDAQEVDGTTPLHFVCDTSCVLFEEDHDKCDTSSKPPPNHEAVLTLLSYSIHAATIEDDEEMSPLEHAIMSDASLKTVKLLQAATSIGLQLSRLQSFIMATTSCLQPQEVDFISSSGTNNTDRLIKRARRVSAYLKDSKSIV